MLCTEQESEGDINPVDKPIATPKTDTEAFLDSLYHVSSTGSYDLYSELPEFATVRYLDKEYSQVDALHCRETAKTYYPKAKGILHASKTPAVIAKVLRYPSNGQVKLLVYSKTKFVPANPKQFQQTGEVTANDWTPIQAKINKLVKIVHETDDNSDIEVVDQPVLKESVLPARRPPPVDIENEAPKRQKTGPSVAELQHKLALHKDSDQKLQQKVQKLKEQNRKLTEQLKVAKEKTVKTEQFKQTEMELERTQAELERTQTELERTQTELERTQADLEQSQVEQRNSTKAARHESKSLKQKIKSLEAEVTRLSDELRAVKSAEEKNAAAKASVTYYPVAVPMHGSQYPSYPTPSNPLWPSQPMPFYPHHFAPK